MRKPNFFIVGAPKCGTTAMSEYLKSHPNIFMCYPKEPHFFAPDVMRSPYVRNMDEYLGLFGSCTEAEFAVGEASADYLMSKVALPEIRSFAPDGKIVVMLRKPAELVWSFHNQLVKNGLEPVLSFEDAWNLQEDRRRGKRVPRMCEAPALLQYKSVGELGRQLNFAMSAFSRERIHVVLFDDLLADPLVEYKKVLAFLGVPDDGRVEFPRVNESIRYRWAWAGQFPKRLRRYVARPLAVLRRKAGFRGTGIIKILDSWNTARASRLPLGAEFSKYLNEVFKEEVEMLEALLGRDLSHWRS